MKYVLLIPSTFFALAVGVGLLAILQAKLDVPTTPDRHLSRLRHRADIVLISSPQHMGSYRAVR